MNEKFRRDCHKAQALENQEEHSWGKKTWEETCNAFV